MARFQDEALAYALLRLTLGVNIAGHGFIRITGGIDAFLAQQLPGFEGTPLPLWVARAFLPVLPFVELAIGLLIIVGLFSRPALAIGALMLTSLTFGLGMQGQWGFLGLHLSYAVVYFILIFLRRYNTLSLDTLVRGVDSQ
jgi:thiosulfate dehydrogenase [quinone] large subunit